MFLLQFVLISHSLQVDAHAHKCFHLRDFCLLLTCSFSRYQHGSLPVYQVSVQIASHQRNFSLITLYKISPHLQLFSFGLIIFYHSFHPLYQFEVKRYSTSFSGCPDSYDMHLKKTLLNYNSHTDKRIHMAILMNFKIKYVYVTSSQIKNRNYSISVIILQRITSKTIG